MISFSPGNSLTKEQKLNQPKIYPKICKNCAGEMNVPCGNGLGYCGGLFDQIIFRLDSLNMSHEGLTGYKHDEYCPAKVLNVKITSLEMA